MSHPATELGTAAFALQEVGTGTTVRPGRSRTQPKSENSEKARTVPPASRKKSPPARKAPARGRYVDEYACPF